MCFDPNNLVWIDLEMTGLDPDNDLILEIATVVTDNQLKVIADGPVIAVHQSDQVLESMGPWCANQHRATGLTQRSRESKYSEAEAERETLEFLREYVPEGKSPMCGNSIGQDRRFLYRYMPELEQFFHYRNFDVSVLKIMAKRWYPQIAKQYVKKPRHQALSDVYDSIEEMKFYREHLLIKQDIAAAQTAEAAADETEEA